MKHKIFSTTLILLFSILVLNIILGWINKIPVDKRFEIENSVTKSIALLQKTGYKFTSATGCSSCHNNSLTSMSVELAKKKGVPVIDSFCVHNIKAMENMLRFSTNSNSIREFIQAKFISPYMLLGLYAEKYPASIYSDISVDYLINQVQPDGSIRAEANRVPLENGDIHLTAVSIRAIDLYASGPRRLQVDKLIERSKAYLEKAETSQQQELAFQLLGLQWCGSANSYKHKIAQKILLLQHSNGGWSQLATMDCDAYATGQCLYALYESGMVNKSDKVFQNGIDFLLRTQDASGAWIINTRSSAIQPYTSADFPPYDKNQFISAAATNWAALSLLNALPDKN